MFCIRLETEVGIFVERLQKSWSFVLTYLPKAMQPVCFVIKCVLMCTIVELSNKKQKCHSYTGVFQTFCQQKPTTWFLHKWNIGQKWVNDCLLIIFCRSTLVYVIFYLPLSINALCEISPFRTVKLNQTG